MKKVQCPVRFLVNDLRNLVLEPPCPVDGDLLDAVGNVLDPEIQICELQDGSPAYQLTRLKETWQVIRTKVESRVKGKRHAINLDWRERLDRELKDFGADDAEEAQAHEEKMAALNELAQSRVSVLIGSAGTGKTTLLSVLCREPVINRDGILLLAPTGKARVRMQQATKVEAQTLAQFLCRYGCYDELTGTYLLSTGTKIAAGKTVIVDEASMLTEEQLGALLSVLNDVDRFILVGDPRQLPPIWSGRPFVDIVTRLAPENVESLFPRGTSMKENSLATMGRCIIPTSPSRMTTVA